MKKGWQWLLSRLESFWHLMSYGIQQRVLSAVIVATISLLCVGAVFYWHDPTYDKLWSGVDRWFTVVTLIIAIVVWFGEIRQDWETQLQSRVDVFFFHLGQPLLVCKNALLPGEHDVRNLGQTIGQQMCGVERQFLKFHAATIRLKQLKNYVTYCVAYRRFQVVFDLTHRPEFFQGKEPPKNQCLFWSIPCDSESPPSDQFKLCTAPECQPE